MSRKVKNKEKKSHSNFYYPSRFLLTLELGYGIISTVKCL